MRRTLATAAAVLLLALASLPLRAGGGYVLEEGDIGTVPAGWKVEATNPKGPVATWQVVEDDTASGGKAYAMVKANDSFGGTYNVSWTDAVSFRDGVLEVRLKAVAGEEDQGGGLIWRVRNKDDYYIARYNPLEKNFRIYTVQNAARKTLADVKVDLPAGQWISMKIVHRGKTIEGWLDGRKLLTAEDDLFPDAGGVGLWTKADAVTRFDDFKVVPEP